MKRETSKENLLDFNEYKIEDPSEIYSSESRDSVTGLPGKDITSEVTSLYRSDPTSSPTSNKGESSEMGNENSKPTEQNDPKFIISEDPQFLNGRKRVVDSEITGNCVPWSDHVYFKLFLDTEGRSARLMVLKCEISYVDVFSDEEHSLYKSRFIGGKSDGVAELFAFDLMKSDWETKIPQSQAIELNVDIVMSSSPIHQCSETLLNLLQLEKSYLKHHHFDGQLNVMIRFAHAYAWDVKDDAIRERVHNGLRGLFREGVNLEVMSAENILEEMRVDRISSMNDDKIKEYISKRHLWKGNPGKSQENLTKDGYEANSSIDYKYGSIKASTSKAGDSVTTMTDSYYVNLHGALWDIIQDTKRIRGTLEETMEDS